MQHTMLRVVQIIGLINGNLDLCEVLLWEKHDLKGKIFLTKNMLENNNDNNLKEKENNC